MARASSQRRRPRRWPRPLLLALLPALLVALAVAGWVARVRVEVADERLVLGQWQPLDVRGWSEATSGFRAPGQSDLPLVNAAPGDQPVRFAGRTWAATLGLYPYGEAVYPLNEGYDQLAATVAVVPRPWQETGAARLVVFGDGAKLYDSGPLHANEAPFALNVGLDGVRELRLVAVAVDDAEPALVYLAEPRLLRPLLAAAAPPSSPGRTARLRAAQQQHQRQRAGAALDRAGAEQARAVRRWRATRGPADAVLDGRLPSGALALSNPATAVLVETAGAARGSLSVVDLGHGRLVAEGVRPAVVLPDGRTFPLAALEPGEPVSATAQAVGLGEGRLLRVPFHAPDDALALTLEISLFPGARAALLQLRADRPVERFVLLDSPTGGLLVGEEPRYVTDFSRPREAAVRDDGLTRGELVALGAPVFLWSERDDDGLVLAVLDETTAAPRFDVRREPGDLRLQATVTTLPLEEGGALAGRRSPRLYLEPTETADPRAALEPFRSMSLAQHPPPPLPEWFRHQWGSWYVFGTAIDEGKIREFVDYIANNLADVGPWHLLLDAGWFIAEGRPDAELGRVDTEKFPSGIRALVDYAHARGVRVILYYSAPYVDTRAGASSWLALPGFIEQHPDWLIPLGSIGGQESYAYDFSNSGLQAYMRDLLRRYYVEWNADGLLVDMLGHAEGAALNLMPPDRFGVVGPVLGQSLDIYRFLWDETRRLRPAALVEGAWDTPLLARSYAHTWRFADDEPQFRAPYPFGGLVEHVDYAVLQRLLLAQRSHLGAVIGAPDSQVNRWWLGAGLALGSQVVLSLPLTVMGRSELADYRAYLAQARPFVGITRLGEGWRPDTFATTRDDGTTFLGVLNRARTARDVPVDLEELGLDANTLYLAYDVEQGKAMRVRGGFVPSLPGESFRLYVLRSEPGVLWTSSGFTPRTGAGCLSVFLDGPADLPGWLMAHTPRPRAVMLDGHELPESAVGSAGWQYEPAAGLLRLHYADTRAALLEVFC